MNFKVFVITALLCITLAGELHIPCTDMYMYMDMYMYACMYVMATTCHYRASVHSLTKIVNTNIVSVNL